MTLVPAPSERHAKLARVGDILKVRSGYAFSSSDFCEKGVVVVRQSDLGEGVVRVVHAKRVPDTFLHQLPQFIVKKGDLLIGMSGSLGKVSTYNEDDYALQNQRTGLLQLQEGISTRLAKQVLMYVEPQIVSQGKGIAVQNVSAKQIEDCTFRMPGQDRREEVADELDLQFSRLDAAIEAMKRAQENLKRYRASVLQAAVTGRLVPTEHELAEAEGRDYETGPQLLTRILAERKAAWDGKGKYKEPDAFEEPSSITVPMGWVVASLSQLSTDASYGTSVKCSDAKAGPIVLRIPNVSAGRVRLDDLKYAPKEFAIETGEELLPGDFLIIRTNGSRALIGRGAIVNKTFTEAVAFASYLIRFRITNRLSSAATLWSWISTVWSATPCRKWIEAEAASSAGQYNISLSTLNGASIPLPPLAEQARIVAEVERRLSVADQMESTLTASLTRATRLRQAILKRAFSNGQGGEDHNVS